MPQIEIAPAGSHEYDVTVADAEASTRHRVRVPARLRERLGLAESDEQRLVHASFGFLLEREPAEAILSEFDLDVIPRYFPEYEADIGARLT